jgi:hypothetical protein
MVGPTFSAVDLVDAWIPSLVEPGSVLVLSSTSDDRKVAGTFCALLNCPFCGRLEMITEEQFNGSEIVTCGGDDCPGRYFVRNGMVDYRASN